MTIKKIFLTVGSRFPFDRLVKAVDSFLAEPEQKQCYTGFAQTGTGIYHPTHMECSPWLLDDAFTEKINASDILISHAGMGNIILAAEYQKPIILLARQARFGEHTNNHQLATVQGMANRPFIYVMEDPSELTSALSWAGQWQAQASDWQPRNQLAQALGQFIESC